MPLIDLSWSAPVLGPNRKLHSSSFSSRPKKHSTLAHTEKAKRGAAFFSNNPSKNLWTHSLRIHSCEPNFKKHQDQGYPHFPVIVTPRICTFLIGDSYRGPTPDPERLIPEFATKLSFSTIFPSAELHSQIVSFPSFLVGTICRTCRVVCQFAVPTFSGWWFQPLWNISQNGNLPQIGVEMKNIWNHHPVFVACWMSLLQII